MTPEELDLARAKALEFPHDRDPISRDEFWGALSHRKQKAILRRARAIRLSDEARGLRVVPVEPNGAMIKAGEFALLDDCPADQVWRSMVANSPFAPEPIMLVASPFAPEKKP